jgi:uncharacterized membrane protein
MRRMNAPHRPLLRVFFTGLLAALPLAATIAIFVWVIQLLLNWLGPASIFGRILIALGLGAAGSEVVGYLLGLCVLAGLIFGLGLLVETGLQRGMASLLTTVVQRIPLVRTVYDLVHKLVALFGKSEGNGLKSMSPVWCYFGGPGGAAALALLGSPDPVLLNGELYLAVLIPTSPVPVGGGLLYVPQAWVTPADVGIEGVTSIYVSMGLTSGEHLGRGRVAADPAV